MSKFCDILKGNYQEIIYLEHKKVLCVIVEELVSQMCGGGLDFT